MQPQKRLAELNHKISDIERERDILADEIQEHTQLLAPFRRYPDDILREIFLACLPYNHNAIMSPEEPPLLLGRVCSRWRSVAYSTPRLWATLHIPTPERLCQYARSGTENEYEKKLLARYNNRIEQHIIAVNDWLLRSGSCPLSISFHQPEVRQNHNFETFDWNHYFSIMESFSRRWYRLELSITTDQLSSRMAAVPATSVPLLKHLHLLFFYEGSKSAERWETSGLINSSQLHTLDIIHLPFQPTKVPGMDWSHLSNLNLVGMGPHGPLLSPWHRTNIQEAYYILSRCPRLVHCVLDIFDGGPESICPPGVISLPFLQSITIFEAYKCAGLALLFECFGDITALRAISYESRLSPSSNRQSPLIALLARTNYQITSLSISLICYTLVDLCSIFTLVPNLTHLTDEVNPISGAYLWENLVPSSFNVERACLNLLASLNGQVYCPRLQVVELKQKRNSKLCDEHIISFLRRRMDISKSPTARVAPLREFRAEFQQPMEEIRAQLSEYVKNGPLTLSVTDIRFPRYSSVIHNRIHLTEIFPSQYRGHARTGLVEREGGSGFMQAMPILCSRYY
jgi:hypothetical protein